MKTVLLIIVVLFTSSDGFKKSYDNFQVYRIIPRNEDQLNALKKLEQNPSYILWNEVSYINRSVDVMVDPVLQNKFNRFLHNFEHKLWIKNVQDLIDNEDVNHSKAGFNFNNYYDLNTVYDWLKSLTFHYPHVTLINGGTSYENRTILGVKVSFKPGNKIIFLEGGIHSREWISSTTVLYILNKLLSSTDPTIQAMARSRDWYIFPNFNPDGYQYSRTRDRMWRKTRKPYGGCYGADPNRNWGYYWMHGGASNSPCHDSFAGSSPFSEIETKSMAQFIGTIANNIEAYIGFHSYSQVLLIPFGHAGLEVPPNNIELKRIGNIAIQKLAQKYNTRYRVGNIPEIMYVASGGSGDWVLGAYRNVRYAYTFELRDQGRYGFLLPPNQIIPTGEETFDAIAAMVNEFNKVDQM
ncbi:hypothetical protein RN001_004984 [Aquatica leii]|uniref:Zinc carboxypeptidase A 1 n=1 Tax=Aquatica leii TaxID=1421715 RepID=A0AAN7P606_9COLE|nr:hypothetical protein RN001_004984 [Aquatica leii]